MISNYPKGFPNGLVAREIPIQQIQTGQTFWVGNAPTLVEGESAASDSNRGTFFKPFATLDYAISHCVANRGDTIRIKPGYSQSMTAADAVDIDVAGVTVIGEGRGTVRPKFIYNHANGEFVIGAANVRIENLWFVPSVTAVTHAIDVEAAATDCQIINCDFSGAEAAGTDEFNAAITVVAGAARGTIQACYFNSGAAGAIYAISLSTPIDWRILDNTIMGDYSTACVGTITAAGEGNNLMLRNVVMNGLPGDLNAVACFTQSAAGTWTVGENLFAADVATFILFFTNYTSTVNLGNRYTDDTSMAATATEISATIVVSADG